MNTKGSPSEQAPASNSRECMEDSSPLSPLPSAESCFPPRACSRNPSPAPEGQSDPASQPKKTRRIIIIKRKPPPEESLDELNDDKPPRKIIKRKPPPEESPVETKPRRKIIIKRKPPPKEPPVEEPLVEEPLVEEPSVKEPLAEISGNKPPTKIKLKLNPTR